MKAPFPYFGGKSQIASLVWERIGDVPNLVEPFFGSGAVLLARPHPPQIETANDADGLLANFWRALQADPDGVAHYADWPVNENDLTARHVWLVNHKDSLQDRLEGDPDYYDVKMAGWWVWGISCWIGGGWCAGNGPWNSVDGKLVNTGDGVKRRLVHLGDAGKGVNRQMVHLGPGLGVNRKRVHLGNAGKGVNRQLVHLGDAGQGVNRQRVHLGNAGQGVKRQMVRLGGARQIGSGINTYAVQPLGVNQCEQSSNGIRDYMRLLADRLRRVRVCCGDFERVLGPSATFKHGLTGVFLDPPYAVEAGRDPGCYVVDSADVSHRARQWCIENGDNPLLRIVLAGYESEHDELEERGWQVVAWKASGGYARLSNGDTHGMINRDRERLWFSPYCIPDKQMTFEFA